MFQPTVGDELQIAGEKWVVLQHPTAPGMPYGQEGRAAVVYQLGSPDHLFTQPVMLLESQGRECPVPHSGEAVTFGRGEENQLVFPQGSVSREHGALVVREGKLYCWDNSSRNGTFLNGQKIEPQSWVALPPGASLRLGTAEEGVTLYVRPEASCCRALKVFKAQFRSQEQLESARHLAALGEVRGLRAAQRKVICPDHEAELLQDHPDLLYAVLMPWIDGRSWMECILERRLLSRSDARQLALNFLEVLLELERRGLAHCDLSGPNLSLGLYGSELLSVQLVDLEQVYSAGARVPSQMFSGSPGYAHRQLTAEEFGPYADRFSGALLLCEMLAWCHPDAADMAWSESFFEPREVQTDCPRARQLQELLQQTWGEPLSQLFQQAWSSERPSACPSFADWQAALMGRPLTPKKGPDEDLLDRARQMEEKGLLSEALALYREALAAAPAGSAQSREIPLIIQELEGRTRPQPSPAQPVSEPVSEPISPPTAVAAEPRRKVEADPELLKKIRELEGAPGLAPRRAPAAAAAPKKPVLAYALVTLAVVLLLAFVGRYHRQLFASGDVRVQLLDVSSEKPLRTPTTLRARVENETGKPLDKVFFYLGEVPLGEATSQDGQNYQLQADRFPQSGRQQLRCVVRASTGLEKVASQEVTIAHFASLQLLAPDRAHGRVPLKVLLEAGGAEVRGVEFWVGSTSVGKDLEAPYEWTLDLTGQALGPLSVAAVATLEDGVEHRDEAVIEVTPALEVVFYLSATDAQGAHPRDLTAEDISLREDGVMVPELQLSQTREAHFSAAIVLDHSGSMSQNLSLAQAAARSFVDRLQAKDSACVLGFSDRARGLGPFTSDHRLLKAHIDRLRAGGGTSLYDAIDMAADLLADRPGRKTMVVLTDGRDEDARGQIPGSSHSLQQALDGLKRNQISLYAIGLGKGVDRKVLEKLSRESGGRAFLVGSANQLKGAYDAIDLDLRSQYLLKWLSPRASRDSRWRRVEVTCRRPEITLSAPQGYQFR